MALAIVHEAAAADASNTYEITFAEDRGLAHVQATFINPGPTYQMMNSGAEHLVAGWATFVHEFRATDAAGNELNVSGGGGANWIVDAPVNEPVTISYDVLLDHPQYDWPSGIDGAAYPTDTGIFFTARALLVVNDALEDGARVLFNLPADWRVSVPWAPIKDSRHAVDIFEVTSLDALTSAIIQVGLHEEIIINRGPIDFVLTFDGTLAKDRQEAFVKNMSDVLDYFTYITGGLPDLATTDDITRLLVVLNSGQEVTDGEVIGGHINLTINDDDPMGQILTNIIFAHEIFHLWNGHTILRASDGSAEWFGEGMSNYWVFRGMLQTGLIDDELYFTILSQIMYPRFIADPGLDKISISRAGVENKSDHWGLIYLGGWMVAAALDFEMRQATENQKSLDDLIKEIYTQYAGTDQLISTEDIQHIAEKVAGRDFGDFFDRYVTGTDRVPLSDYLGRAGLDVSTEDENLSIDRRAMITPAEQILYDGFMGK